MKDLILVGKQGSGKGTQAKILAKRFGYHIFETGAALRAIAQKPSPLGQKVKAITTRGDLVPNEIVMEIVHDFLQEIPGDTPVIFDGIPRSEEQRQTLENLFSVLGRDFRVLEIRLSNEEAMERLMMRARCNDCGLDFGSVEDECPRCGSFDIFRREDDNPESIAKRLENFDRYTAPLLSVWEKEGKVVSVNGEQEIGKVTEEMFEKLKAKE
ncbi:MAG: nucleoside monophosphate kinase [Candidatus Gracilibacteria bacterium]|nr:nucleoside monophosphate kinase [Candidatus Gracilibacteria bacterium]